MNMKTDKEESFSNAFDDGHGGCRGVCNCGKEFYNPHGGWDWEKGELETLAKSKATAVDWSISHISFLGKTYLQDCDCWKSEAEKVIRFLESHSYKIVEYFNLEKKRKTLEAEVAPVVI